MILFMMIFLVIVVFYFYDGCRSPLIQRPMMIFSFMVVVILQVLVAFGPARLSPKAVIFSSLPSLFVAVVLY